METTDEENDLIVADYFAMLADDIARRPYNKAEHRRALRAALRARSDGSVEFKHQNISAVLKGLGETWITGYKPAFNFQSSLEDAVLRWLDRHAAWFERAPASPPANTLQDAGQLWPLPPPTLSNSPPPKELEQMLRIARKYDVAGRDARNRALGRAGEERVLRHERAVLRAAGRDDLARAVRWVSGEDGDGPGYDIAKFHDRGPDPADRGEDHERLGADTVSHLTERAGRGGGAKGGLESVSSVELRARAAGLRVASAAGGACDADGDHVSGEFSMRRCAKNGAL
jgi:hypothetical protein